MAASCGDRIADSARKTIGHPGAEASAQIVRFGVGGDA
jgi:hypothetical protein